MAEYGWPKRGTASVIGSPHHRIDGLAKSTGAAKYSYDINASNMLIARLVGCPHGHCTIKSIDTSEAARVPGVVSVQTMKKAGDEIKWEGDPLVCVAAETEGAAAEGAAAVRVEIEPLDVFVTEQFMAAAEAAGRVGRTSSAEQLENEPADDEDEDAFIEKEINRLFDESDVVVEGEYGIQVITHSALETHGSTCEWDDGKLTAHLSTQNVSGTPTQFAGRLDITADDVTVHCDYIGGGFGAKFAADTWDIVAAQIARVTGRPVKLLLSRDLELKNGGSRPSAFLRAKVGADNTGLVKVWDSEHWGTSGAGGGGVSQGVVPYVLDPPNRRRKAISIATNASPARAWRAPNHPQACAVTQTAYDDVARALGMDSYDVFMRNLQHATNGKGDVYAEEMKIAADLMDWKSKWHPHGAGEEKGSVVTGLGMALHMWGGGGHPSSCIVKIHPDGAVETFLGSQDLGTGTRTVIAMVLAETFGLDPSQVKVNIGSSKYPQSGPSGGSTTVGGVSESNRRASQDALLDLLALAGKKLEVDPSRLEAKNGRIQVRDNPGQSLSWKEACSLLGTNALEIPGNFRRGTDSPLSSSGVGGVQMAEVAVDKATGVVKLNKYVAVQDIGLVINPTTAKSQIYGAIIMGLAYSLFEERIMDPHTGTFLNAELEDYSLARLGDTGEIVIEFYQPDSEYERGVVGLGEPPVISPGGALSNAVCNALGVRVPVLPMTPLRVLDALEKARVSA